MSKTAIGFFKEPLSQEEIDYIYDQLRQEWADHHWHKVYQELKNMVSDVTDRYCGAHISEEFFQERISSVVSIWVERHKKLRELRTDGIYTVSVAWSDEHPGHYSIDYSPDIILMRDGGYQGHSPQIYAPQTHRGLVYEINRHLVKNPELREVPPGCQKVEDLNNELMGILHSRGYQSETSNDLPDFSEFLIKLVK